MRFTCVEINRYIDGSGKTVEHHCGSRHKTVEAAVHHSPRAHTAYLSSNQPYEQERLEVRDEAGQVHASFTKTTRIGCSSYGRWERNP